MAIDLKWLREINWKRHINTTIKVFSDFKNAGLLFMMGFILYGIGWDTVLRPSLSELKGRDEAIQKQKEALGQKEELQKQYDTWGEQLKGLTLDLIAVPSGSSGKVLSVSESGELLKMSHGVLRDKLGLQPLQPPHDHLEATTLSATDDSSVDLLALLNGTPKPQTSPETAAPSRGEGDEAAQTLSAEQYRYDLKVTGTYAALVDLVNQLVMHPKLVKINKIVISKSAGTKPEDEPDPKEFPDYPVKLDMVVSLALFLYVPAGTP